jgi:hypothetical protein
MSHQIFTQYRYPSFHLLIPSSSENPIRSFIFFLPSSNQKTPTKIFPYRFIAGI